jgi:xanthine dehydrogenase accessory factor
MLLTSNSTPIFPTPERANGTDEPAEILKFAVSTFKATGNAAIATLIEIRGSAARALGSTVAVASDGRYCGYMSGGCVEAAVASEALLAMREGKDRQIVFGEGSPYFDIVLPCGGGITVAIHCLRSVDAIEWVLDELKGRRAANLHYSLSRQSLSAKASAHLSDTEHDNFLTVYQPSARILLSGQSIEAEMVQRIAAVSGYDVVALTAGTRRVAERIDEHTAVVLLHHDIDAELPLLIAALRSTAFYVGALGSSRTHRRRVERLEKLGFDNETIARIRAPIGMFGPVKDARSLALSVLADIAAAWLAECG